METLFADRETLRTKLRDLLVEGVRSGALDGDRAKQVAEDVVDTLDLAPETKTPTELFLELDQRYPDLLAPIKDQFDAIELKEHDVRVAAQMQELIVLGNFAGAIQVAHGEALTETATPAPLLPAAATSTPLPPVDGIQPPAATSTPITAVQQVAQTATTVVQQTTQTASSALGATITVSTSTATSVGARAKQMAGGFLHGMAGAISRAAQRFAPPPPPQ